jgi:hypothetical protein
MINTPETKYSVTKNECYRIINRKITELHSIGKKAGDAEDELNKILIAGFLLNTERGIAFEHDQWFEYFAAIEVFANALPITGLPDTDTINELLYFATGMFDTSSVIKDEQKYLNFIKELSDRNIAVFNWCMDNFNKHERATLTEMTELRKGDRYSLNDIEIKYRNIINSYCHLSSLHFPDLSKKFYPNPHLKVGALVGIVEYDVVHNYGLRQITEGEEKDVLIFTRDDKDKLSNDYFLNLVLKSSTAALPYLCMICRNKLLQELYFQK